MAYILLVESNEQRADTAIRALTVEQYRVRHAPSAASALMVVRMEWPWLVLLNLELPDISGHALALRLKQQLGTHTPPMVALSEYNVVSYRQSARQAGCETLLVEPFSVEELIEVVRRFERSTTL